MTTRRVPVQTDSAPVRGGIGAAGHRDPAVGGRDIGRPVVVHSGAPRGFGGVPRRRSIGVVRRRADGGAAPHHQAVTGPGHDRAVTEAERRSGEGPPGVGRRIPGGAVGQDVAVDGGAAEDHHLRTGPERPGVEAGRDRRRRDLPPRAGGGVEGGAVGEAGRLRSRSLPPQITISRPVQTVVWPARPSIGAVGQQPPALRRPRPPDDDGVVPGPGRERWSWWTCPVPGAVVASGGRARLVDVGSPVALPGPDAVVPGVPFAGAPAVPPEPLVPPVAPGTVEASPATASPSPRARARRRTGGGRTRPSAPSSGRSVTKAPATRVPPAVSTATTGGGPLPIHSRARLRFARSSMLPLVRAVEGAHFRADTSAPGRGVPALATVTDCTTDSIRRSSRTPSHQ